MPIKVPPALLQPCPISLLPIEGATWRDVFELMKMKDAEQRACNERFVMIRNWQEGELADGEN